MKQLIAGNWKMHTTLKEALELAEGTAAAADAQEKADVAVCPPFVYLEAVAKRLAGTSVAVGAQNVFHEDKGAFTGEVSPDMLLDVGCSMVIIGHSERRHIFGETDEAVNKKVLAALRKGLVPILCVGETLEERESGSTSEVVRRQVTAGLRDVAVNDPASLVIAYEPVWAIGTGKTATPEQAQEVHALIRGILKDELALPEDIRILYGGSVKPENASSLLCQPDVDGALVGGASLKADSFKDIILSARERSA